MSAELLRQAVGVLERIDDSRLTFATPLSPGGSVGKHLRHCLDFYRCFLEGLPLGRVDYVHRGRDQGTETDRGLALAAFRRTLADIERLDPLRDAPMIRVRAEEHGDASEADWSLSTPSREMQFLASHTVHHYAIVAMMLRASGFEPPPDFGVASSTLRHWERTAR